MTNISLAVPNEMKKEMERHPEINWSAVARHAIQERLEMMHRFKEFTKDSTMTEEDALRLGREVNKGLAKRHGIKK